ncbi:hypothetical protein PSACC_00815 [Paramicrosporidium saccamoebae]|uniref:Exoribonuclease phosphorolytic domain-containing protein n=1 Tax=Paramicrosporidium saccamoebae TaxID=1246581 RepID=A0A2H9TNY1_9FUNG|nr:hypothetical protein PSACC_00815 [Paramicrosporidium saccamoebae]
MELGPLNRADGSSRWECEGTVVIVAVYGPVPVKTKQEQIETATVVVQLESLSTPPSLVQNSMALKVQGLLEQVILGVLHPRSLITIAVQPVNVSSLEAAFPHIFNACVLALLDAGIPLGSLPVAVEEDGLEAVYSFASDQVKLLYQCLSGVEATMDELVQRLESAQVRAQKTLESIQQTIQQRHTSV